MDIPSVGRAGSLERTPARHHQDGSSLRTAGVTVLSPKKGDSSAGPATPLPGTMKMVGKEDVTT
jgi:hypothetical protein